MNNCKEKLLNNIVDINELLSNKSSVLVISPHSDDAAFSIGGIIQRFSKTGTVFQILTCFSKSKYVIESSQLSIEEVSSIRKKEDQMFRLLCNANNVELIYLDYLDAPLRQNREMDSVIDSTLTVDEHLLVRQLAKVVKSILRDDVLLWFPMAIGNHIDHVITNLACQSIINHDSHFMAYLDQPYVTRANSINNNMLSVGVEYEVSENEKRKIIDCYPSQVYEGERSSMLMYGREILVMPQCIC